MKQPFWFGLAAALLTGGAPAARSQVPAVVTADRVNVRSRPSVSRGEVITQLARDQKVIVFEEGLPSASPKEPVNDWTRIELPAGSPVWVSTAHVTLPAGTVKAQHLNVRAGPSEDFGVLGTISKGTTLRSLEQRNGWMKIEAPLGLSGYVASAFLHLAEQTTPKPASPPSASPMAQPSVATNPAAPPPRSTNETVAATVPPAAQTTPGPAPQVPTESPAQPSSPPSTTEPAATATTVPLPASPSGPAVAPEQPAAEPVLPAVPEDAEISAEPRVVRREGIVRATFSVQAPTPYSLDAADNGKLLNYLLPQSTNVLIRPFRGQRVRIVGEEYLEPRWANAPVIVVHQIKLAP